MLADFFTSFACTDKLTNRNSVWNSQDKDYVHKHILDFTKGVYQLSLLFRSGAVVHLRGMIKTLITEGTTSLVNKYNDELQMAHAIFGDMAKYGDLYLEDCLMTYIVSTMMVQLVHEINETKGTRGKALQDTLAKFCDRNHYELHGCIAFTNYIYLYLHQNPACSVGFAFSMYEKLCEDTSSLKVADIDVDTLTWYNKAENTRVGIPVYYDYGLSVIEPSTILLLSGTMSAIETGIRNCLGLLNNLLALETYDEQEQFLADAMDDELRFAMAYLCYCCSKADLPAPNTAHSTMRLAHELLKNSLDIFGL